MSPIETTAIKLLDKYLSNNAEYVLTWDRDETDSYYYDFKSISNKAEMEITKEDIISLNILPQGSKWVQALGWQSFFGLPFKIRNCQWLVIGAEEVRSHSNVKAYPVQRTYFYRGFHPNIIYGMNQIALELYPDITKMKISGSNYGRIKSDAKTINEYRINESKIIMWSADSFKLNKARKFRTCILNEYQIPSLIKWHQILFGTIDNITETFSMLAQTKLKAFFLKEKR